MKTVTLTIHDEKMNPVASISCKKSKVKDVVKIFKLYDKSVREVKLEREK